MAKKFGKAKLSYKKVERKSLSREVRREAKSRFCKYCEAKTREECFCHREDEIRGYMGDPSNFE